MKTSMIVGVIATLIICYSTFLFVAWANRRRAIKSRQIARWISDIEKSIPEF